jgi:hypothetical protein
MERGDNNCVTTALFIWLRYVSTLRNPCKMTGVADRTCLAETRSAVFIIEN